MQTASRRRFVPSAITCFLVQEYADKEPMILDDGQDSVADAGAGTSAAPLPAQEHAPHTRCYGGAVLSTGEHPVMNTNVVRT